LYVKSDRIAGLLYANCGLTSLDGIYVFYNIEIPSAFGEPISTIYSFGAKPEILSMGFLIMSVGYLFKVSAAPAVWYRKSLLRVKLSNSGKPLKLLVPNRGRKATGGWINYSCMVISQKMIEKEMGNRGSKSDFITFIAHLFSYVILGFTPSETTDLFSFMAAHSFLFSAVAPLVVYKNSGLTKPGIIKDNKGKSGISRRVNKEAGKVMLSVKEQRVNGSWHGVVPSKVRCTLIGFSLNYRVKILTKGNQITYKSHYGRSYTSIVSQDLITNLTMNPWFATGFSDAESCFTLSVVRNKERKVGWRVSHCFQITIHKKDLVLLEQIQSYFFFFSGEYYYIIWYWSFFTVCYYSNQKLF